MIEAGDVVTAYLSGASDTKRRPTVVISTSAPHQARPDVLLALITSQVEKADSEFDAALYDWQAVGLKVPWAMPSFLFTKPARDVIKTGRFSTPIGAKFKRG